MGLLGASDSKLVMSRCLLSLRPGDIEESISSNIEPITVDYRSKLRFTVDFFWSVANDDFKDFALSSLVGDRFWFVAPGAL